MRQAKNQPNGVWKLFSDVLLDEFTTSTGHLNVKGRTRYLAQANPVLSLLSGVYIKMKGINY